MKTYRELIQVLQQKVVGLIFWEGFEQSLPARIMTIIDLTDAIIANDIDQDHDI